MTEHTPIITFDHVVKEFRQRGSGTDGGKRGTTVARAVDDVSLTINEGDIFGIIGYSGAGKSTLVRLINALEKPTSGTVTVLGTEVSSLSESKLRPIRQKIGMIFQQFNLFSTKTVAQNIAYPLQLDHWRKDYQDKRVAQLLDFVGLSDHANKYPSQLSGGQKKRVALARTLVNPSDVLILDEPTNHLDNEMVTWLEDYLNRFKGVVIMVTHDRYFLDKVTNKILEISHMQISFCQYQRGIQQIQLPVIRDLNVTVHAGEIVAVVGSSGSGKSLLAHGIMGILPYNATMEGEVYYCGENLTEKKIKQLRGKEIVLVPQSTSYLDPLMKVGQQICKGKKTPEKKRKLDSIFEKYGLGKNVQEQYPFELSGGMTRRVMISTALIETPKLVIADEPTPGLDPKLARRAMEHFRELADMGAAVLVITHDLELTLQTVDRIQVFYAGYTIEDSTAEDFAKEETLRHPYTKALWRAMPGHGFHYIDGVQPYARDMQQGCPFAPRCGKCTDKCKEEVPWHQSGNGYVRCIYDT